MTLIKDDPTNFYNSVKKSASMIAGLFDKHNSEEELVMDELYKMVDDALEKSKIFETATCTKGCYFCCHDLITISALENNHIARYMKRHKIKPNKTRLKKQNKVKEFSKLKWSDKKCSLLDENNLCSIYPVRPMVCRTHNSQDELSKCDKRIDPNSSVKEARAIELDAMQGALIFVDKETKQLKLHNQLILK